MRNQILVLLDKGIEFQFTVAEAPAMSPQAARAWLDEQFTTLDCEPLRASGKVLTADKVLVVTQAAGQSLLGDEKWSQQYVGAVHAALGKPMIRVDVPAMAITY
ncbi:MAG: hypothetical protein IPO43_21785 [Rhodoferax sp.]|nr:hypothetical protein [Rhodoferax sp.]